MGQMINDKDFKVLCDYIHRNCGILLSDDKKYLINNRLSCFLVECGFADFTELASKVHSLEEKQKTRLLNKITTNETFFFRDNHPFKTLKDKLLPETIKQFKERRAKSLIETNSKIKIWSLACSTGQEAYSIAMTIEELCSETINIKYNDFQIIGTDISHEVLKRAKEGSYTELELKRGLTAKHLERFFEFKNNQHQIATRLKTITRFEYLNLISPPSQFTNHFDIIFCRNVLIYFDNKTKEKILQYIYQKLAPNGALLIGASESLYGLDQPFKSKKINNTTVYYKPI